MIRILPLSKARRHKRRYEAVITIEDPGIRAVKRLRFHRKPHPDHLVLSLEDIDAQDQELAGPDIHHMAAALSFGRIHTGSSMLVHCHVGVCRSTAVGLAIMADRLEPGMEAVAVAQLLASNPDAAPNLCMLEMADALLGRDGVLVDAWNTAAERTARVANYRKDKLKLLTNSRHLFHPAPYSGYFPAMRYEPKALTPSSNDWLDETFKGVAWPARTTGEHQSRSPSAGSGLASI